MPMPSKPQLKINALKRLVKELEEYEKEEVELEAKVKSLSSEASADDYEIRNTSRVLEETKRVKARVFQSVATHAAEVAKLSSLKPEEQAQAKEALEAAKKG